MMRRLPIALFFLLFGKTLFGQVFLNENFNAGTGSWVITDGGTTLDTWFGTTGGYGGSYLDGTEFVFVDSDAAGSGASICLDELFTSPVVNTAGATTLYLEFDQYFRSIVGDTGLVEVFDGTSWVTVATIVTTQGGWASPSRPVYNISAYANANMQVRFRYIDACIWAWYWAIDNVYIYAPLPNDAATTAITAPGSGRAGTSLALTATEDVSINIYNNGADTIQSVPVFYQVNGQPVVGPEMVMTPIPPGSTLPYTFSTQADLSLPGSYSISAWTALPLDADVANDTFTVVINNLANPVVTLPFCQDFELAPDTSLQASFVGSIPGLAELDLTTVINEGRLRTLAGVGFAQSGSNAITLDRNPSGTNIANFADLTYNMSAYDATQQVVLMDIALMEHGDEVQPNDSIWVRGNDTLPWIGLVGWNTFTGGVNGVYLTYNANISAALVANGQNFSSSFQLRVGQEDNFPATSPTVSDGLSFDDVCFTVLLDTNVAASAILNPSDYDCGDSLTAVTVEVLNDGTDTLTNIPVTVIISGPVADTLYGSVTNPVAYGETGTVTITGFNSYAGGTYNICAYTTLPGDLIAIGDTVCTTVLINGIPTPDVAADTICAGDSAMVYVINPDTMTTYTFYDSLTGGNMVHMGPSFMTGVLNSDTTFYLSSTDISYLAVGAPDNSFGGGANYTFFADGLQFNVLSPMNLDTVHVYPLGPGNVVVNLLDNANNLLQTTTVAVTTTGTKTAVPVGFTILPGTGYKLEATGTTTGGLYRNAGGAAFPFVAPGVMEITNAINNLAGYYYFWYDWRISTAGCEGTRIPVNVNVINSAPVAGITATSNGLGVAFADATNGIVNSWSWDFGDGNTDNVANPTHTYAQDGSYNVCLTVTDQCGQSDTTCMVMDFCETLVAGFAGSANGLDVSFANNTAGTATASAWDFGDGAQDTAFAPTHTYAQDGSYLVCLVVTNFCGESDTLCDTLTVCADLGASISFMQNGGAGLDYDFADSSAGNGTSWMWDFGDGNTSTAQHPTHSYAQNGAYTVTLIVSNICGDSDTTTTSVTVVGLDNLLQTSLEVYPNPNAGTFTLELPALGTEVVKVVVRDLPGRAVYSRQLDGTANLKEQISLRDVSAGTYLLEVSAGEWRAVRRLVIR